jgi:hypothetical protein
MNATKPTATLPTGTPVEANTGTTTTRVETPQTVCRAALVEADITPPVGIYHRMWGAALHDRATGVHRPLMAVLLWIAPREVSAGDASAGSGLDRIIVGLDHCILATDELAAIRRATAETAGLAPEQILVSLTHTHGSGWMSRDRANLPGGELIGPYLDGLARTVAELAVAAKRKLTPATVVYGEGRCPLAAHRDFPDPQSGAIVCGFHPEGPADDTLVVARVVDAEGGTLGTVVNYACHPTTLAWENTRISPDYVGRMREVVEAATGGPCLFLQGASGDLGPRDGFVGDSRVADRNGEQLGYAALAALAALPEPGTAFAYAGPVLSGATLGTWRHVGLDGNEVAKQAELAWQKLVAPLPYRADLPTIEQTESERAEWQVEEDRARAAGDELRVRDCRAEVERRTRQLTRLRALAPGDAFTIEVWLARLGNAVWAFTPGELYQEFQRALRAALPGTPVVVVTLTNDWQPGYIPPAQTFGHGIYQEVIAATAAGAAEQLTEAVVVAVRKAIKG